MPQRIYEIEDPRTGRVLEIEGDRPPTEAELSSIFASAGGGGPRRTHRTEDYLDPVEPQGSAVGRFASNAAEMLNPITMVKGLWGMAPIPQALGGSGVIEGPMNAGRALLGAQREQFEKGKEALGQGRYSEAAGRFGASMLPLLGPIAAEAGEQIGSGDVAGGLGKAVGVLAPFGVGPAVRGAARLIPESRAAALEAGAAARVADVMSPKSTAKKNVRWGNKAQKIAPTLAKDPEITGNWSAEALRDTVKAKHLEAQAALDDVSEARLSARTFETQPIIDDLVAKRREYAAQPVEASQLTPETVMTEEGIAAKEAGGRLKDADRRFALQWLADDLKQMSYESGEMTKGGRHRAYQDWRPGDAESANNGIGIGSARVAGTQTQEMFHALGVKGSRPSIAARVERFIEGKRDPKLEKLGDALVEMWNGEQFDAQLLSEETVKRLGIKRRQVKNPMVGPTVANMDPEMVARWFPKWAEPGVEPAYDVSIPPPVKRGVPLGKEVVPGPAGDRVGQIDQAIREIRQLGPVARYEDIRKIRQAYDGPAKVVYNPVMTPDYLKVEQVGKGAADVTGTLREHLAKWDPETAAANVDYSLYRSANDIMQAAAEIEQVRPKIGRKIAARGLAAITGGQLGGVSGAVAGAVAGPSIDAFLNAGYTTKLQTAKLMQNLAKAIRKGDAGRVESLSFQLRKLATRKAVPGATRQAVSLMPAPEGSQ